MTKQELFELTVGGKDLDRQDNFILIHEIAGVAMEVESCKTYEELEKLLYSQTSKFNHDIFTVVDLKEKTVHIIYQENLVTYFKNKKDGIEK